METKLTTITSYWNRPEMLEVWLEAMRHCTVDGVEHLLYFVGEKPPTIANPPKGLRQIAIPKEDEFSIGHCHNMGARQADSEWIMKIDVDTLPSLGMFRELLVVLDEAGPREWFNCGMLYFKKIFNTTLLTKEKMPICKTFHSMICANLRVYSQMAYSYPAATNWICRRQDYLDLGGCDARFNGYGWEDYQQIYMLERWQRGSDPLPGPLHEANVTQRCRDEISRPKALEFFRRNQIFCLFHRWHTPAPKKADMLAFNRRVLMDHILCARGCETLHL